jgi:hypothetical protein
MNVDMPVKQPLSEIRRRGAIAGSGAADRATENPL